MKNVNFHTYSFEKVLQNTFIRLKKCKYFLYLNKLHIQTFNYE